MTRTTGRPAMFLLGRVMATPAALRALANVDRDAIDYVGRHVHGDWGEMGVDDATANTLAVFEGTRVVSSFALPNGQQLLVITEADRSATTVLLSSDY